MDVKTLCLGVLSEGDASGYDIKKYFECTFSHFFVAGFGSIYPALAELTRQKLVTCREETQSNRPDRKIYSLTDAGRKEFLASLMNTPPRHKVRSEFMVLMHFAHLLPPDRVTAIVDERIGDITRDLQMLEQLLNMSEASECRLEPGQEFGVAMVREALRASREYIVSHRDDFAEKLETPSGEKRKRA